MDNPPINYEKRDFPLHGHTLLLYVSQDRLFLPNAVTVRFSRAIQDLERKIVFDIGTGVGPLAIWAALQGAKEVHAVDSVEEHIEVANMNIKERGLEKVIHTYHGNLFSPFENTGIKADIVIGDVSGIAEGAARALGWYPPNVPTGGEDGTEVIIALLEQAPKYMAEHGVLYFPIALDLSDREKIENAASKVFKDIIPMFEEDINFYLTQDQYDALMEAYNGNPPNYINIKNRGSRHIWHG